MIGVRARAKINLHLHITGREDNGYHLLDSLVAFTDLCDDLHIHQGTGYHLTLRGNEGLETECQAENNLVTKATRLLAAHYAITPDLQIDLNKRIPVGAGLGGGSADAAATLHALCQFWSLTPPAGLLDNIAAQMGSDIVACLAGHPIIMRATGNTLFPAPSLPDIYGVLVNPKTPCPTPLVYKTYATSGKPFSPIVTFPEKFSTAAELCTFLNTQTTNDLTDAAIAINSDVETILKTLKELPDCLLARLSGSGSTCFAIFPDKETALKNKQALEKSNAAWWVEITKIGDI